MITSYHSTRKPHFLKVGMNGKFSWGFRYVVSVYKTKMKPWPFRPGRLHFNHQYFDLLFAMTEKEIKARYKNAFFGFLWMFLNPLFQMLIIGFVFQYVTKVSIPNYFVFLFAGLLPWNFFSYTITKNTPLMVYERALLQKAKFPRETLILAMVLANAFHLIISIGLMIPILLIIGRFQLINFLLLPIAMVWIILVTTGFSL